MKAIIDTSILIAISSYEIKEIVVGKMKEPTMKAEIKRLFADGDYVVAHSHYQFTKEGNGSAVVDIFRIKDGKADEHWDVIQEIPGKKAHNNGMF